MTFNSVGMLAQLQDLERQIAESTKHLDTLKDARTWMDRPGMGRTVVRSQQLITAMARTTWSMKSQIVTTDGLGPKLDSLAELALRALRMVLLTELAQLQNEAGLQVYALSHARGQAHRVADLATFAREELERITRTWSAYRDHPHRVAFRFALAAAAQAQRRLGKAPALERFLRQGVERQDCPALAASCARIRAAFAIRIEVQRDHPLLRYAPRLREAGLVEEL